MKRIAFAAATAALLGTGCISSSSPPPPPSGAIDTGWTFLRWKTDNTTISYGCDQAGVDNVIVSFQMSGDVQVPCKDNAGDGALITGIAPGTQSFTITGRRGGVALFQSQPLTVTIAEGQTTSAGAIQAAGIQADLAIYANFLGRYGSDMGWSTCYLAGVRSLDYAIADYANTVVASGTVSCSDPAGISFTGVNALDRDNYVIRLRGFPTVDGTGQETFDSASTAVTPACSGQAFDHYGQAATDAWDVFLFDTTLNTTICT